jgi:hypothetical protein
MSRAEVHAILGPPGDRRTRPLLSDFGTDRLDMLFEPPSTRNESNEVVDSWCADDVLFCAVFNPEDRLWCKSSGEVPPSSASLRETLRWRAKRQWHSWFP